MAREAGAGVHSFTVRHQLIDGDLVCSIIDWEMAPVQGMMTSAEVLQIRDGKIVHGELIYDAEDLRRAMAQGPAQPAPPAASDAGPSRQLAGRHVMEVPGMIRTCERLSS